MFSLPTYQGYIQDVDNAATNHQKGQSFEILASYLLGELDGVAIRERDIQMPAEEIDLLLWNAKTEEVFVPWDNVILVECKNWSAPVGAAVLDNFINKVRMRHLKTGIFIAANGVTGDFVNGNNPDRGAVYRLHDALTRDGIRIVVLRMDDLRAITRMDDLRELIKDRYCKIYMHKVF